MVFVCQFPIFELGTNCNGADVFKCYLFCHQIMQTNKNCVWGRLIIYRVLHKDVPPLHSKTEPYHSIKLYIFEKLIHLSFSVQKNQNISFIGSLPVTCFVKGGQIRVKVDVLFHNFFEKGRICMKLPCKYDKLNLEYERRLFYQNQPIGSAWGAGKM